jgi:hypothetical protein
MCVDELGPLADVRGKLHMEPPLSSEQASVEGMFLEGAKGDSDICAPTPSSDADDELDESEPSLDKLIEWGNVMCAEPIKMLDEYDSWSSLVKHYKKSKKYGSK